VADAGQRPNGSQACPLCRPSGAEVAHSPFREVKRLASQYAHENVSLAQCVGCESLALYYSADVYDDFWQYWCLIDEAERQLLTQEGNDPDDSRRPARARAILEKHSHLMKGPVRGFEWIPAGFAPIVGPPW